MWIHTQDTAKPTQWRVTEERGRYALRALVASESPGLSQVPLTMYLDEAEAVDLVTELAKAVGSREGVPA